ncbi:MAG: nitroreductase family protein [Desulfobacterales bacterium]|nr:nitroreductase family protein [Desulfobacterales bacterium]
MTVIPENPILDVLHSRCSIRKFQPGPVAKETLETLVRAGMSAPTAGNRQPWAFVAVDDKDMLVQLAEGLPYAGFGKNAPAAVLVCGNMEKAFQGEENSLWIQDCSAACQNILIAAEALGLGATWTAIYPLADRVAHVQKCLGLPNHIIPLSFIPVGTPGHTPKVKDKWEAANLHWQKWDSN